MTLGHQGQVSVSASAVLATNTATPPSEQEDRRPVQARDGLRGIGDRPDAGGIDGDARHAPRTIRAFAGGGLLHEAAVERVAHELGAGGAAQLLLDVRAVGLHRAHREVELLGDLGVRVPERDEPQDLGLTLGELVRAASWAAATRAPRRAAG